MTDSIWEIAAETPWWVYVLFIYLVRLGYLARKPRIVPLKALFILPMVLLTFSLMTLYDVVPLQLYSISLWLFAISLGISLGWLQYQSLNIKTIKGEKKLYMPGTWSLLIIILLIFTTKFYFGYQLDINPAIFLQAKNWFWLVSTYGIFTGLFIGRLLYALRLIKTGPFL